MIISLRDIYTVAGLFWRRCSRTHTLLSLVLFTGVSAAGIPALVQGDGSLAGEIRILLTYSLGAVVMLLALSTLWIACTALPEQVESRGLHLLLTKPLRRRDLWLGYWLGLLSMDAFLLLLAGLLVYGQLQWRLRKAGTDETGRALLLARSVATPREAVTLESVRARVQVLRAEVAIPADVPEAVLFAQTRSDLDRALRSVAPGAVGVWHCAGPPPGSRPPRSFLRFRFSSSQPDSEAVHGTWRVGTDATPALHEVTSEWSPYWDHEIEIPAAALSPDVRLEFANLAPGGGATVIFDEDAGLALLSDAATFEVNLLRALAVILFQLAFLAALGLAAGSLFTLPIAVFTSFSLLAIAGLSRYIHTSIADAPFQPVVPDDTTSPAVAAAVSIITRGAGLLTEPLFQFDVLSRLSAGELIPLALLGRAFVIMLAMYGGALAILGIVLLQRREIGLPS